MKKKDNPIKVEELGANVYILGNKCFRCGHSWRPKNINKMPTVCPKCKSPYWNKPRERGNNNA